HQLTDVVQALVSLCLSALVHAPSSTLFPYTTLFRSQVFDRRVLGQDAVERLAIAAALHDRRVVPRPSQVGDQEADGGHREPLYRDRKSTRLNSSHVAISYAVFCLHNKKSRDAQTTRS